VLLNKVYFNKLATFGIKFEVKHDVTITRQRVCASRSSNPQLHIPVPPSSHSAQRPRSCLNNSYIHWLLSVALLPPVSPRLLHCHEAQCNQHSDLLILAFILLFSGSSERAHSAKLCLSLQTSVET